MPIYLRTICLSIANTYDQNFNPDDPSKPSTVFDTLSPHEHRFGGIAGMNVVYYQTIPEGGLALCIRKGAGGVRAHDVDLADWGLVAGRGVQKGHEHLAHFGDPTVDAIKTLQIAIHQCVTIVI